MKKIITFSKTPQFIKNFGPYLVRIILKLIWCSCKVIKIEGEQHLEPLIKSNKAFIPVYWHQHHIYGAYLVRRLKKRGVNMGYLISPSSDGDLLAQLTESWGLASVRGSSTNTGAKALRDLYKVITTDNVSPVNTSDGPTGPVHVFKPGAVMLAQLTQCKLVPISYSANRYWQLKTWDQFIIPKPFSKIVISIGDPVEISRSLAKEALDEMCQQMSSLLLELQSSSQESLKRNL